LREGAGGDGATRSDEEGTASVRQAVEKDRGRVCESDVELERGDQVVQVVDHEPVGGSCEQEHDRENE
jgi:hypothetical protein